MTTLFDITLRVAKQVWDVMDGTATAGTATSLTDTLNLTQQNQYWDRGALWIRSGTHAGKFMLITAHAGNTLEFSSLGVTPIAAGTRYSVMRSAYPLKQIISCVQQALDETHVTGEDATLTGDGAALSFILPDNVNRVKRVEFENPSSKEQTVSNHWRERFDELRFDYGYAPCNGDVIHVFYRKPHDEVTDADDIISPEIDLDWLTYKSAENFLWWGVSVYGNSADYRIEEHMNKVMSALKGKSSRRDAPDIILRTAGFE